MYGMQMMVKVRSAITVVLLLPLASIITTVTLVEGLIIAPSSSSSSRLRSLFSSHNKLFPQGILTHRITHHRQPHRIVYHDRLVSSIAGSSSSKLYSSSVDNEKERQQKGQQILVVNGIKNEECNINFDDVAPHPSIQSSSTSSPRQEIVKNFIQEQDDAAEELISIEKKILRMEGLEPYVLVSTVTSTTSYNTLESLFVNIKYGVVDEISVFLLISCSLSTIFGIYSTVVFSMSLLYGKTAIGMDREDAYYHFMNFTALQRYRGFQAFSLSLVLFLTDVFLLSVDKITNPTYQNIALVVAAGAVFFGYTEFQAIIQFATPIFTGIIPTTSSDDDESDSNKDVINNGDNKNKNEL